MKKVLLSIIALAFFAFSTSAETEREVRNFAPQAGDFALSVSANPFLNYVGNIFGSHANAPAFSTGAIMGRYFISERNAIRVGLSFSFDTDINKTLVPDLWYTGTTVPTPNVENVTRESENFFMLNIGYEFRRGTGRLQAFYGADVVFAASGSRETYQYGNRLGERNPGSRVTEMRSGTQFGFGLNGFIGVEYFVAPRISIGAEVGLSMMYFTAPKGQVTVEAWNASESRVETTTSDTGFTRDGNFNFSTNPISNGQIFVSFFF